eukprot:CAMPEP_0179197740 /NCGR_PEP_ID=MMETSP0796-20121207/98340_1 /TAXON_ID=73915 /ORGANISM="Pyrodinium bahamense, Strain pbaha01" /LENGTH=213 /DNA_ID=CAMNT_0020902169 /DNA_START=34 /DNA_END=676 /DNA_ORIENTATION=+
MARAAAAPLLLAILAALLAGSAFVPTGSQPRLPRSLAESRIARAAEGSSSSSFQLTTFEEEAMARAAAAPLLLAILAALLAGSAFVPTGSQPRLPRSLAESRIARAAEGSSSSSFQLTTFEESPENTASASVVFCFVLGLVFPLLGGFNFGLLLAATGYSLTSGGIKGLLAKSESGKAYAETAEDVSGALKSAGGYALKAYNGLATQVNKQLA